MIKLISYLKSSIEDAQGEASVKRLMAVGAFTMLQLICILSYKEHTELIVTTEAALVISLVGITTYQTIKTPPKDDSEIS